VPNQQEGSVSFRDIAGWLGEAIASGEMPPGAPVPSEAALSRRWKVARATVRRALILLQDDGLIETVPGRGRFVRSASGEVDRTGAQFERIAEDLKRSIQSEELVAGARLPTEADLCRSYGVSVGTARRALRRLEEGGLVVSVQGRGRFVAAQGSAPPTTRAEEIAESLRQSVVLGIRRPGEKLPGELQLARQYKAGRGTVRRALAILEADGVLITTQGSNRVVGNN